MQCQIAVICQGCNYLVTALPLELLASYCCNEKSLLWLNCLFLRLEYQIGACEWCISAVTELTQIRDSHIKPDISKYHLCLETPPAPFTGLLLAPQGQTGLHQWRKPGTLQSRPLVFDFPWHREVALSLNWLRLPSVLFSPSWLPSPAQAGYLEDQTGVRPCTISPYEEQKIFLCDLGGGVSMAGTVQIWSGSCRASPFSRGKKASETLPGCSGLKSTLWNTGQQQEMTFQGWHCSGPAVLRESSCSDIVSYWGI